MIIGSLSIVIPNAMLGELTQKMADALLSSDAKKTLLPLNQEGIDIIGVEKEPLPHMIDRIVATVRQEMGKEKQHV